MATSTVPCQKPTSGRKCYVTPAFSGFPKQRGTKSEVGTSPLPSKGPKKGRKCYVALVFSGVPSKGDKIKSGCTGGEDNNLDVQSKGIRPNKISQKWCVCSEKHPLRCSQTG